MCWKCGAALPREGKVGFRDRCDACGRDLHICLHCRFHKPGAHWDCLEPMAEQVVDKERSNLCEYFQAAPVWLGHTAGAGQTDAGRTARGAFEDLFRK